MKIAVFTDTYEPQKNGVAVFLSESLRRLSRRHRVVLFAPGGARFRTEDVSKSFRIYWMPAIPFPLYEGYMMARSTPLAANRLLKKEKPDIVHLHAPVLLGLHGLAAAKRRRIPIVATYHTHFPDYLPHLLKGRLGRIFGGVGEYTTKKLIKLVFSRADIATAPTRELVAELRRYGLRNVAYLPNGIESGKLRAGKADIAEFRKQYRIPEGRKIILYAGRMSVEKKLGLLLEAFGALKREDATLLMVGSGPKLGDYQKMASRLGLGNVIFTGYVEDRMLAAAYSIADVFASPSDSETFGLTFVEAMSFGLPAIGVDRLGPKELISDGKDGFLVKAGSAPALARAMRRMLDDGKLRRRMSSAAKKKAGRYTMARCVAATTGLYRGLLAKRRAKRC